MKYLFNWKILQSIQKSEDISSPMQHAQRKKRKQRQRKHIYDIFLIFIDINMTFGTDVI